jgi:hypothetical protein
MVIYVGDVPAQASVLVGALANDLRTRGAVSWRRAPQGSRWAEDGAIVLRCWIPAADAAEAESVGNDIMDAVVQREACAVPPRLLVPVLADVELVAGTPAADG